MSPEGRWLGTVWPFLVENLPTAPARVIEIGCGSKGGFVPALLDGGYDAVGVDPQAPPGSRYRQIEFERYTPDRPVDVVVACTSLHHVADLDDVMGRTAAALVRDGILVVIEWAWERFDKPTATWCFDRLGPTAPDGEDGWLHAQREHWVASGKPWAAYVRSWATAAEMHTGREIRQALESRFVIRSGAYGPYFFSDLREDVTEAEEQAAIEVGQIRATGVRYIAVPHD